ncbi:MAG: hypothetical protein AAFX08_02860 [Pseudomonadota bacterium]
MKAAEQAGLQKSEAQRRRENLIEQNKPAPVLKPKGLDAQAVDRMSYYQRLNRDRQQAAYPQRQTIHAENRQQSLAQYLLERQQAAVMSPRQRFNQA